MAGQIGWEKTDRNHLPHIQVLYLKGCGMALSASIRTPEVQQTRGKLRTINQIEDETRDSIVYRGRVSTKVYVCG